MQPAVQNVRRDKYFEQSEKRLCPLFVSARQSVAVGLRRSWARTNRGRCFPSPGRASQDLADQCQIVGVGKPRCRHCPRFLRRPHPLSRVSRDIPPDGPYADASFGVQARRAAALAQLSAARVTSAQEAGGQWADRLAGGVLVEVGGCWGVGPRAAHRAWLCPEI